MPVKEFSDRSEQKRLPSTRLDLHAAESLSSICPEFGCGASDINPHDYAIITPFPASLRWYGQFFISI